MSNQRKIQSIYTDGACTGNPGPGGWGVVAYFSDGKISTKRIEFHQWLKISSAYQEKADV